jgi:protein-arginine kinase activator protein McsA
VKYFHFSQSFSTHLNNTAFTQEENMDYKVKVCPNCGHKFYTLNGVKHEGLHFCAGWCRDEWVKEQTNREIVLETATNHLGEWRME